MPKSLHNAGKHWAQSDDQTLTQLAKGNTPTRVIGLKLGRSEDAVRRRVADIGVSLKPINQSPYGRRHT